MLPLVPKESAAKILASSMSEAEWLLSKIESEDGWFRFPPILTNAIKTLKIETYPLLYENEPAIAFMLQRAFLDEAEINNFNLEFEASSTEARGAMLEHVAADIAAVVILPKSKRA